MRDLVGEGRLDPLDITNPVNTYLLLSGDAQDEITGTGKKRMKFLFCGQRFTGEVSDSCPERFSPDTEEVPDENDDRY